MPAPLVVILFLGSMGCGSQPEDNWYEYSKSMSDREEEYVRQQMESGVSEVEAEKAFGLIIAIEKTEGREPPPGERY